ncbi:MAG TPA: hypothetical protein GXX38_02575 [Clostridia bacterium]|nr:hypothetical protein [Clostridia bacterium]
MARLRGNKAGSTWQLLLLILFLTLILVVYFYREEIINLFQGTATLQLVSRLVFPAFFA